MKKFIALLFFTLVALSGLTKVQGYFSGETYSLTVFEDEFDTSTKNMAGQSIEFYDLGDIDTSEWDDIEDIRQVVHTSLGDDYVDVWDKDWVGEYFEDIGGGDPDAERTFERETGPQDEQYETLQLDGDVYMAIDLQTEQLLIVRDYIQQDQGYEKITVIFHRGLTSYEAGYNAGKDDAEPADARLEDETLIVESEDGTEYDFGYSVYNEAYQEGYESGEGSDFGYGWVLSLFGAFTSIFAIELLPGMTIGLLVGIVLVPSVVLAFLKLFRG